MDHTRHQNIFSCEGLSVSLVGAGGIGAMTALMLAKMGVSYLTVYDSDTVAPENMATQLHRLGTEDEPKVEALQKTLRLFSDDTNIYAVPARVTANLTLSGRIVISGVDSIAARKDIWQAARRGSCSWYLDARMSAEEFHLYCVDMHDPKRVTQYDALIGSETDEGIPDIACTEKATFFCAAIASGHIGSAVRKIVTGHKPAYYAVHNIFRDKLLVLER